MEQYLNGVLPLGLSKHSSEPVMSCGEGECIETPILEKDTSGISYDGAYQGYLGYGYNVITKRYYNSLDISLGAPILSREPTGDVPHLTFRVDTRTHIETTNIAALCAAEYSKKVSTHAGLSVGIGAFKAGFNMAFTNASKVSTSKSFATRRHELTLKRECFDKITTEKLRAHYLSDSFRCDVNDPGISAEKLFTKYGTHLLLDIRLGGRMELDFMHEQSGNETEFSLETSLEASYMAVSGDTSIEIQQSAKKFFESSSFHCVLIGGSASTDVSTFEKARDSYGKWVASLDPNESTNTSLAFIGTGSLDNPTSVLPVWTLADDQKRQDSLREGFLQLLKVNGDYFKNLQDKVITSYIKDIFVGYGDTPDAAKADVYALMSANDPNAPRYVVLKDLNCSARGKYEYLGYTTTTNSNEAIRGIRGMTDPRENNCHSEYKVDGCTYNRLSSDLNCRAGGHFVYLYWTKDAAAGKPLLDADVEINYSGFDHFAEPGWSRVRLIYNNGDLNANRGTGSKTYDIFIWVKREL